MENKGGVVHAERRIINQNLPMKIDGRWLFTSPRMSLPSSLDDIDYSLSIGDGTLNKPLIVRINSKRSIFRGELVSDASYYLKRRIENLFILAYTQEPMKVIFE